VTIGNRIFPNPLRQTKHQQLNRSSAAAASRRAAGEVEIVADDYGAKAVTAHGHRGE